MSHEVPGEMPNNNPFEDVEDMKISDNPPTEHHWDENEEMFKQDRKIFEKYSNLGNLDKGSLGKNRLEEGGKLQSGQCKLTTCPAGKKRMSKRCFGCDQYELGNIKDIGGNVPEEPVEIMKVKKDKEDKPAVS